MIDLPMPVVTATWLNEHLGTPGLVVLDASWYLPKAERDGAAEWAQRRIPGARHFDYDTVFCDQASSLPRMMPDADTFTAAARALGLHTTDSVVVYDSNGMFSAPRAWWMLRAAGHQRVAVLDGGLAAWESAGGTLSNAAPEAVVPGDFTAEIDDSFFVDADAVADALKSKAGTVLDARAGARFAAAQMPGAANLPYTAVLADGQLETITALTEQFSSIAPPDQALICTCGSGVTACVLALAATAAGHQAPLAVYDGSWTEWKASGRPIIANDT